MNISNHLKTERSSFEIRVIVLGYFGFFTSDLWDMCWNMTKFISCLLDVLCKHIQLSFNILSLNSHSLIDWFKLSKLVSICQISLNRCQLMLMIYYMFNCSQISRLDNMIHFIVKTDWCFSFRRNWFHMLFTLCPSRNSIYFAIKSSAVWKTNLVDVLIMVAFKR